MWRISGGRLWKRWNSAKFGVETDCCARFSCCTGAELDVSVTPVEGLSRGFCDIVGDFPAVSLGHENMSMEICLRFFSPASGADDMILFFDRNLRGLFRKA